jgi:hypothetical protein
MKLYFRERNVGLWCTCDSHQFSVNLPRELLLIKSVPCGTYFFKSCLYMFGSVQNVFQWKNYMILGVSKASDLFSWLRSFPLLWNLKICHYDGTTYKFTASLVSFSSFWWLLFLQNRSVMCRMIQWSSMDKPFIRLLIIFSVIFHTADEWKCDYCLCLTDVILSHFFAVTHFYKSHS